MPASEPKQGTRWLGIGVVAGLAIGLATGLALRDPSIGIAGGVVAGALITGAGSLARKKK